MVLEDKSEDKQSQQDVSSRYHDYLILCQPMKYITVNYCENSDLMVELRKKSDVHQTHLSNSHQYIRTTNVNMVVPEEKLFSSKPGGINLWGP